MTVAELIKHLKTFPKNAEVLYSLFNDYAIMEEHDIEFVSKGSEKVKYRGSRFSKVECFEKAQEALDYQDVVIFPGN